MLLFEIVCQRIRTGVVVDYRTCLKTAGLVSFVPAFL